MKVQGGGPVPVVFDSGRLQDHYMRELHQIVTFVGRGVELNCP